MSQNWRPRCDHYRSETIKAAPRLQIAPCTPALGIDQIVEMADCRLRGRTASLFQNIQLLDCRFPGMPVA
jgi:hypothetical protein